jgi:polar amino acid transport system substrate-binding protein
VAAARVLRVGSALPDPPFEVPGSDGAPGFGLDIDLTRAIGDHLGWGWELHRYTGDDFDGIFAGLGDGSWDVVASGATVTDHRETLAHFCAPYLRSGQSLVVRASRVDAVHTVDDLHGDTIGVQHGNTSEPVVRALVAAKRVAGIRVYPYDRILQALDDVEHGAIGGFMKLEPVMRWLTADRPGLAMALTGITDERIALSVRTGDDDLAQQVDGAQRALAADGTLAELGRRWLRDSDPHATAMLT